MGAKDDPNAVCDEQGKVYGVDNLRVVDCSLKPDTVRANLQFTVYMMAERISAQMRHKGDLEADLAARRPQCVMRALTTKSKRPLNDYHAQKIKIL